MSLLRAMYAGVSGLDAESGALGVVGDNIANTNTVGFKQSRAVFENVLGAAIGSTEPGAGVRLAKQQQIFAQGSLTNTGQATDVALSGDGFLVVHGNVDGQDGTYYTRAGQLSVRASDGALVDPEGLAVQGYAADGNGGFATSLSSLTLPNAPIPPKTTSKISIAANLNSSAAIPTTTWDPQNPSTGANLSTSVTAYDSLGGSHSVDVYFVKSAEGQWDYHMLAKGSEVTPSTTGNVEVGNGQLTFDSTGALQSVTNAGGTPSFTGATANQPITLDFGKPTAGGGSGLNGMTQYGSASTVNSQSQDGYSSGSLAGVKIDPSGTVQGVYTNGQTLASGTIAVAKFRSNDGLGKAGHNLWAATEKSGEAALGASGSGGRAAVVSGALEQSNVDVTAQFVELISHQRAFQANSKTITTADQMLQELMQIKQ